jgi:hypothetical protein
MSKNNITYLFYNYIIRPDLIYKLNVVLETQVPHLRMFEASVRVGLKKKDPKIGVVESFLFLRTLFAQSPNAKIAVIHYGRRRKKTKWDIRYAVRTVDRKFLWMDMLHFGYSELDYVSGQETLSKVAKPVKIFSLKLASVNMDGPSYSKTFLGITHNAFFNLPGIFNLFTTRFILTMSFSDFETRSNFLLLNALKLQRFTKIYRLKF